MNYSKASGLFTVFSEKSETKEDSRQQWGTVRAKSKPCIRRGVASIQEATEQQENIRIGGKGASVWTDQAVNAETVGT